MQRTRDREPRGEEATLRLVQDHAAELLRFARRFSLCADDAHDAYQRGIEILVRRMRTNPPEHPLNWLRTVIRREALSVRLERERFVGRREVDLDREEARHLEDPSERIVGHEQLGQVAEALQRLKAQEVTALLLRAQGLSYKEICAHMNWTYTKTNRCITEGRRALRERIGDIETGAECARWQPQLSLLADGEASMRQRMELRPHLRTCPACRATLRAFHDAPRQVAALVPVALVPVAAGDPGTLFGHFEAVLHAFTERATFATMRVQGALDTLPGTKVAAVAASTAALAGGGAAIEHAARAHVAVPPRVVAAASASTRTAAAPSTSFIPAALSAAQLAAAERARTAQRQQRAHVAGEFGVEDAEGTDGTDGEFAASASPTPPAPAARSASTATATGPPPMPAASPPTHAQPAGEFVGP